MQSLEEDSENINSVPERTNTEVEGNTNNKKEERQESCNVNSMLLKDMERIIEEYAKQNSNDNRTSCGNSMCIKTKRISMTNGKD